MTALRVQDDAKLGELIVYISEKSAGDARFGSTKLNKLLYFSDFFAFGLLGRPITGATYRHLKNGPAPKNLEEIRDHLVSTGAIRIEHRLLNDGKRQTRTVALRSANTSNFLEQDLDLVKEQITTHWERTADQISGASHNYVGWKMTKENETIPYETIFLSDVPLTTEEIYRGQELARADRRWLLVA